MRKQDELYHWGIKGMKWGVRRFQNADGSLTPAGRRRYGGDGNAGDEEEKIDYAPKRNRKDASEYTDEELRAQINRMQMERQYRDLQGQTNIREDDPNRALKAERERLQLQKDVKNLRNDVYGGQSFVKTVMTDASKQVLTKAAAGIMSYGAKEFITEVFNNPDLANAVISGSAEKKQAQDDKKDKKKDNG
jgi:hypothetical protein